MKFYSWSERCDFLEQLQDDIIAEFGKENYNVFLFGSFLREDYNPETSDIDLAVYSKDSILRLNVVCFLQDYLEVKDVPYSIIQINEREPYAFVAIDPLSLNISVTEYYPDSLRSYRLELVINNLFRQEEQAMFPDIYTPDGKLLIKPAWRSALK